MKYKEHFHVARARRRCPARGWVGSSPPGRWGWGVKTVLPNEAHAKITYRLVDDAERALAPLYLFQIFCCEFASMSSCSRYNGSLKTFLLG